MRIVQPKFKLRQSAKMSTSHLLRNSFVVQKKEATNKRFDKIDRVYAKHDMADSNLSVTFDINSDLFQLAQGSTFTLTLAADINGDSAASFEFDAPSMARYCNDQKIEYAMFGRVFRFEREGDLQVVYASFGGLMLEMKGPAEDFTQFKMDQQVFLFISTK